MNKKKTKKEKKVEKVTNPIEELVQSADQVIIVTAKHGNIDVTGFKGVNYSYQAKGLLLGALDSYLVRPVISALNNNAKNTVAHLDNTVAEIKKATIGKEDK